MKDNEHELMLAEITFGQAEKDIENFMGLMIGNAENLLEFLKCNRLAYINKKRNKDEDLKSCIDVFRSMIGNHETYLKKIWIRDAIAYISKYETAKLTLEFLKRKV